MAHRVLVTGFEPFGGHSANPTEHLVRSLPSDAVAGVEIATAVLPVDYEASLLAIREQIAQTRPAAVIMCGLYASRPDITVEAIAVNVRDTPTHLLTSGERGRAPSAEPVEEGPDGIFSTLPVAKIVDAISTAGIPASISYTAGTYVCNNTMYGCLNQLRRSGLDTLAGFIHFPESSESKQASTPGLPLDLMRQALLIAIQTTTQCLQERSSTTEGAE